MLGFLFGHVRQKGAGSGGGGPTTTPSFIAVGTGDNQAGGNNTPAYGTNASGDCFILQAKVESGSFATPSGWTLIGSKTNGVVTEYAWSRDTRSSGSESGTVTLIPTGVSFSQAQIFTFRNVATSAFVESVNTTSATDGTVPGPTVVAGGNHRLAVCLMNSNSDAGMGAITGMSGGTWSEAAAEWTSGVSGAIVCNTAALDSGGTISGGSANVNGSNGIGIGFALVGV